MEIAIYSRILALWPSTSISEMLEVIGRRRNCRQSSGEWMLNHLGPNCLIAGVWFVVGLASLWRRATKSEQPSSAEDWI